MYNSSDNNSQKSSNTAVHIIAIVCLVIFIISQIVLIALMIAKYATFIEWLIFTIPNIISLILLFSLDDAIRRITVLENKLMEKGVVDESELNTHEPIIDVVESPIDLTAKGITFCKKCNYQLFPEDTKCPNCGAKVERTDKDN